MKYTASLLPSSNPPRAVLFDGNEGNAYTLTELQNLLTEVNAKFPLDVALAVAIDDAITLLDSCFNKKIG